MGSVHKIGSSETLDSIAHLLGQPEPSPEVRQALFRIRAALAGLADEAAAARHVRPIIVLGLAAAGINAADELFAALGLDA